jgi:hypothetical protein
VIRGSELELVLSKWCEEETLLRFDFKTPELNISTEGFIERIEEDLLAIRLRGVGYIEVRFGEGWGFDFGSPDTVRDVPVMRVVHGESGEPERQGDFIVGRRPPSETCLLIEIEGSSAL